MTIKRLWAELPELWGPSSTSSIAVQACPKLQPVEIVLITVKL